MDGTLGGAFPSQIVEEKRVVVVVVVVELSYSNRTNILIFNTANTKADTEMIHTDQHTCSWWLPSKEHYYPLFQIWTSELTSVCVFVTCQRKGDT